VLGSGKTETGVYAVGSPETGSFQSAAIHRPRRRHHGKLPRTGESESRISVPVQRSQLHHLLRGDLQGEQQRRRRSRPPRRGALFQRHNHWFIQPRPLGGHGAVTLGAVPARPPA
jgi:hypothetical protein